MRPLIEHGHVFLAQPPLYKLKWQRSEHEFVYSDRERDAMLSDLLELGLTGLHAHLKAEHASYPCNPDIHVYVKPAASR